MTRKMLSISTAATIAALAAGCFSAAAHAAPQSYLLICDGGGSMRSTVLPNGSIQLNFGAGSIAGSPGEGECTWVDRGFGPGEPTVLAMRHDRSGAEYLLQGMLDGGRFFVHAYNDGGGRMIVTSVGP